MTEHVTGPDENGTLHVHYEPPESNPNYGEIGESIQTDGQQVVIAAFSHGERREQFMKDIPLHIEALHARARAKLPPGTVYEIRGKIPTDYGRSLGVAWYHVDAMKDWPVTGALAWPGKHNELGGYYQLGTFKTPP